MEQQKTNIKAFLFAKIMGFLWATIKFLALNLFRVFLVLTGYVFYAINGLSEWGIKITAFVGRHYQVNFNGVVLENIQSEPDYDEQFKEKFTKDDINELANMVNPDSTIKEIEGGLGVSYRQARKIKQMAKHSPSVNNFTVSRITG